MDLINEILNIQSPSFQFWIIFWKIFGTTDIFRRNQFQVNNSAIDVWDKGKNNFFWQMWPFFEILNTIGMNNVITNFLTSCMKDQKVCRNPFISGNKDGNIRIFSCKRIKMNKVNTFYIWRNRVDEYAKNFLKLWDI